MAQTVKVDIQNMRFNPANVPVSPGDTVEWTNQMSMDHTVTADDGAFDSGPIAANQTFSQLFSTAGTVGYHCEIHPFMKGTVTVS